MASWVCRKVQPAPVRCSHGVRCHSCAPLGVIFWPQAASFLSNPAAIAAAASVATAAAYGSANTVRAWVSSRSQSEGPQVAGNSPQAFVGVEPAPGINIVRAQRGISEEEIWQVALSGLQRGSQADSSADKRVKSRRHKPWLGKLPQWHLQGLEASCRQAVITSALQTLRTLLASMPSSVGRLRPRESNAIAGALLACVACTVSEDCFGYVPQDLIQILDSLHAPLQAASALGGAAATSSTWMLAHCRAHRPSMSTHEPPDTRQKGAATADTASWQGLAAADAKLPVHATLLKCLAMHRSGEHTESQRAGSGNVALDRLVRHLPALLQDCAITAAEEAVAGYMADLRRGTAGATSDLSNHLDRALATSSTERSALTQGGAHQVQHAVAGGARQGPARESNLATSTMLGVLEDAPAAGTPYTGSSVLQVAVMPSLLDARLSSTRALERFRNQVGISSLIRSSITDVLHMYEDRYMLLGVRNGTELVTRPLHAKRTHELNELSGWRATLSTVMEIGDVLAPMVAGIADRVSDVVSWLLVSLIGRGLGLIYKGVRQSLAGSGTEQEVKREQRQRASRAPPRPQEEPEPMFAGFP